MIDACHWCLWNHLVGTRTVTTVPDPVPNAPGGVRILDDAGTEIGWWPYLPLWEGCTCGR